jgi:hypothetical protein
MSRKVFTAGEVLAAADVNSFLMDQTVMSFAGTAARGSAIPSPVEGMVTYLEDIDDLRTYNGSSWVSPYGSTLVANSSFSTTSAVSFNNIFTSNYTNYQIVLSYVGSTNTEIRARLRAGGTDLTSSTYIHSRIALANTTVSGSNNTGDTSWHFGAARPASRRNFTQVTVSNPAASGRSKNYLYSYYDVETSQNNFCTGGGTNDQTAVYDGISIYPTAGGSTITGEIFVYGLRN